MWLIALSLLSQIRSWLWLSKEMWRKPKLSANLQRILKVSKVHNLPFLVANNSVLKHVRRCDKGNNTDVVVLGLIPSFPTSGDLLQAA